ATPGQLGSAEYWVRHVRQAVRFLDGMRCLESKEVTSFLEIGPDAVLTAMGQGCLTEEHNDRALFVAASRSGRAEVDTLLTALAELHVRGVDVHWRAGYAGCGAKPVDVPTYAFQYQRYWLEAAGLVAEGGGAAGWRYRMAWKRSGELSEGRLHGTWLVVQSAAQACDTRVTGLIQGLSTAGAQIVPIALDGQDASREAIGARLSEVSGIAGVLSLLALDEAPHAMHPVLPTGLALTAALAQAMGDIDLNAPLWCATQSAVSSSDSDPVRSPVQAMVWGLGRTVGLEAPVRWGGLVDLPDTIDADSIKRLAGVLNNPSGESEIALRENGAWVKRLVRAEASPSRKAWQPQGTILITGGTGALGAHCARWLARNGAKRLVLVSRQGSAAPGAIALQNELTKLGAEVIIAVCDVASRTSIAELLGSLPEPVTSVVHAAGLAGRAVSLAETTLDELADIVTGKVAGAIHLDALLENVALDAFVVFSSIAGAWGVRGRAAYGAGNAFLEALACQRRTRGDAATSIAWGPWAEGGMASDPELDKQLRRQGIPPMSPRLATSALWQAVADTEIALMVVDADWQTYLPTLSLGDVPRLFDDLVAAQAVLPESSVPASAMVSKDAPADAASVLMQRLGAAAPAARQRMLVELVRIHAATILGFGSPSDIDPGARFLEIGFDSLAATDLSKRLTASMGFKLSTAIVLEYPNASALAQRLSVEMDKRAAAAIPSTHQVGLSGVTDSASIRLLYRSACQRGMIMQGFELLTAVAKLRPQIETSGEFGRDMEPVRLAAGPGDTTLICIPPFVAPSGPHNYAHIALHFDKRRDVYSFAHPGFGDGEPLPATAALIIRMHAEAIVRHMQGKPFALAGYSSGGWVTHSVADYLESIGVSPRGVILFDTLPSREEDSWEKVYKPLQTLATREQAADLTTDDQLTAMAAYVELFKDWKSKPIKAPIVQLRASEPIPEWADLKEDFWKAPWDYPHDALDVEGDHFTLMNENASSTASALQGWLTRLEAKAQTQHLPHQDTVIDHELREALHESSHSLLLASG
ncbi:MAG: SDR family NAD(P)-dependent oxidoreductase, partial [Burkholderiales bacterium]